MLHWKQKALEDGKIFETTEKGSSMTPLIKSGQKHVLEPVKIEDCKVGDIVFCKVKSSYYTHLVVGISEKGLQIGNNHGKINGWTKNVYGRVKEIL